MAGNANFMTWNANKYPDNGVSGITFKEGNTFSETTGEYPIILSNMAPRTGKWYVEIYHNQNTGYNVTGIVQNGAERRVQGLLDGGTVADYQKMYQYQAHNGQKSTRNSTGGGATSAYGSTYTTSIIGCALDLDNGKVWWSKDGTFQNSGNPATGTGAAFDDLDLRFGYFWGWSDYNSGTNGQASINAGQDSSFAGAKSTGSANASDANGFGNFYYTPPSGFLAVCSANMPTSEEIDPAETDNEYPAKNFGVVTYSGTGSTQAITGLGFKPDLVWIKGRDDTTDHRLVNSSIGVGKALRSNTNGGDVSEANGVTAFGNDGFTVGSETGYNGSTINFVTWAWKANGGTTSTNTSGTIASTVQANTNAGFSIVTYTGTGTAGTIGHGLGKAPEWILVKNRDQADDWVIYHIFNGNTHYVKLNSGAGKLDNTFWNDTTPTSSVFSVSTHHSNNASTEEYVAYCWAGIEGFSSFGGWTTASDNVKGPFIHCGFKPKFVMIKMMQTGDGWGILDSVRNTYNPRNTILFANTTAANSTNEAYDVDFLSTGFQVTTSNAQHNHTSYDPYIYMAFADVPAKYSQGG